jgi:catecholate siderophore receptor
MNHRKFTSKSTPVHVEYKELAPKSVASQALLPLGALLLAGSMSAMAQQVPATSADAATKTLAPVTVKEKAETAVGRDSVRATSTTIGKGNQELRDIPQSITVVTEKLIDDRNLDTVKDVLKNTAGVTFQAAEGGEEDIRLRGFSLATTGDIFIDGMRDPAFYDRDTFNNDRVELLRGSASMLFGRGSTGGAVNQVSKKPRLVDESEISTTLGSYNYKRITGDFNIQTGESSALRLNAMITQADNNGAGSNINKKGIAAAYRFGIGEKDEFMASLYSLDNKNGINYGLPWILPSAGATLPGSTVPDNLLIPGLDASTYYGLASDRNYGTANWLALQHIHRFSADSELQTQVRQGRFTRDQHASTVRFAGTKPVVTASMTAAQKAAVATTLAADAAAGRVYNPAAVTLANLNANTLINRGNNLKIQDVDTTHVQSDFSSKFEALGLKHEVIAGMDFASEKKIVYLERTAAQGGVLLNKPQATLSNPNNGASVNEDSRGMRPGNDYQAVGYGVYAQDLMQVAKDWKLLMGLRYDNMRGSYSAYAIPTNAAGPVTTTSYNQDISALSKRLGVLYQPNALQSYHFSYGTSFNTSGDTYSYNAQSANTPPESSVNIELGAKIDSTDKQFTTRYAIFHSVKSNERNTDPDSAATRLLLSGQRHATGFEFDMTGKLTKDWEVFGSYMWMPDAAIDAAAPCPAVGTCLQSTPGNRVGDRSALSPVHSGTVWSTYQLTPQFRFGGGINFRSAQMPLNQAWEAPAYSTIDLMAEYKIDSRWALKANLTNAGDVYYAADLYQGHYVPGAGRTLQVNLTAKF